MFTTFYIIYSFISFTFIIIYRMSVDSVKGHLCRANANSNANTVDILLTNRPLKLTF